MYVQVSEILPSYAQSSEVTEHQRAVLSTTSPESDVRTGNRAKGLWYQNNRESDKRQILDKYARTYRGFRYTFHSYDDYEGLPDQILTITYNGKRLINEDEQKNWELNTRTGRPSKVTGLNYDEKIGNKANWNKTALPPNTLRTVTFRHPNAWTKPAQHKAWRDRVEIHTSNTWAKMLKGSIKASFGLEYPKIQPMSSIGNYPKNYHEDVDINPKTFVSLGIIDDIRLFTPVITVSANDSVVGDYASRIEVNCGRKAHGVCVGCGGTEFSEYGCVTCVGFS
jgi:hypothetical protein